MRDLALDLSLAHRLANAADALSMAKYRSSELVIETKPDLTPVTDADKGIEFMIRDVLSQERPLDLVIGEEFGGKEEALAPTNTKYYWVIDPIDGTKNFVRGVPTWATLIALVNSEHEVILGVVSAPALYRRWFAYKGAGAFVSENGDTPRKLSVSAVTKLDDASISYSDLIGWGDRRQKFIDLQERIWRTRGLGDFWSHMLVAEGYEVEKYGKPFDLLAVRGDEVLKVEVKGNQRRKVISKPWASSHFFDARKLDLLAVRLKGYVRK